MREQLVFKNHMHAYAFGARLACFLFFLREKALKRVFIRLHLLCRWLKSTSYNSLIGGLSLR